MEKRYCEICNKTEYGNGGTYRHGLYFCWKDKCIQMGWDKIKKINNAIKENLKKQNKCIWPNEASEGFCEEIVNGANYCKKHTRKCVLCGEVATHGCSTPKWLVCGTSLCDKCECPNC